MTRLEKCELLKSKGYTYNPNTGKIFGMFGKEITNRDKEGYVILSVVGLKGHHYAWYMTYGNVDFEHLDHKDRNTSNNKIKNLRIITNSQQRQNSKSKGYGWHKVNKKWYSSICFDAKRIHLGYYKTEDEARDAYIEAKKKYHITD
jgi:hypothetical protein